MKFLIGLIASLLVSVICAASFSYALNRTLFDADYLRELATKTNLATDLASTIPRQLVGDTRGADPEVVAEVQKRIEAGIPAENIDAELTSFLKQLDTYLVSDGPSPELNLGEITKGLQSQGLEVPAELSQSVRLPQSFDTRLRSSVAISHKTQTYTLSAIALGLVLLLLLSVKTHSYGGLVYVFFVSAFFQGLTVLSLRYAPEQLLQLMRLEGTPIAAAETIATKLVVTATRDVSDILWIITLVLLGLGLLTLGFAIVSYFRHRPPKRQLAQ